MAYILSILGTGSIQPYIFGSNSLRENIGASELVARATTEWVAWVLTQVLGVRHNFSVDKTSLKISYADKKTEEGSITAEVIYAGGGNMVILFGGDNPQDTARNVVYKWSRRVLQDAPGLDVFAAHVEYEWGSSLPQAIKQAIDEMAMWRSRLPGTQATLGLGVTAACTSTELPANGPHPDEKNNPFANIANRQVDVKWNFAKKATDRLRNMLNVGEEKKYVWTEDINVIGDLPGRDDSYVAVVHADGNGMGKRVKLLNDLIDICGMDPRGAIQSIRTLSKALNETAVKSLEKTMDAILSEIQDPAHQEEGQSLVPKRKDGRECFPFRPVVFGGDDVTWVCAGPLGISAAHRYLVELEKQELPTFSELLVAGGLEKGAAEQTIRDFEQKNGALPTKTPYACAGVAIVKTHYPFFQAYEISEQLAKSAKKRVLALQPNKAASAIDWHFTTTGLLGTLKEIRQREYQTSDDKKLIARPYMLDPKYSWRNWQNFTHLWNQFNGGWFDMRNKIMALREALREGPTAVSQFQQLQHGKLTFPSPAIPKSAKFQDGWVKADSTEESKCAYFDPIEVEKHFVEIKASKEAQK